MIEDNLYNRLAKGILTDEDIDKLVDEIMNIPFFDNLLKENKQLKEQLQQKEYIIEKIKQDLLNILKQNLKKINLKENYIILKNYLLLKIVAIFVIIINSYLLSSI